MKKTTSYMQVVLLLIIAGFLAGCASINTGTYMNQEQVSKINKGVTTKAEVVALLGPPQSMNIIPGAGDGRRMMHYSFYAMQARPTAASFIPVIGGFVGGARRQTHKTLQIILTKSGVVEDYEYSESIFDSEGGLSNSKSVETPTE